MFWITLIFALITLVIAIILTLTQKVFAVNSNPIVDEIDKLLPQTQCGQCGYPGCKPYAEAVAKGDEINKCVPGGQEVVEQLATLLNRPVPEGEMATPEDKIAIIDEDRCVGCVKCIVACPVDAIIGTEKLLHVIVPDYCTGCELCVAPCPVKCISMIPRPKEVDKYSAIRQEVNLPKSATPENLIKVVNLPPQNLQRSSLADTVSTASSPVVTATSQATTTVSTTSSNSTSITGHYHPKSLVEILSRSEYDYAPVLARKHAHQAQQHAQASIPARATIKPAPGEPLIEVAISDNATSDISSTTTLFVVTEEALAHAKGTSGYTSAFVARLAQKLQDNQSK